MEYLSLNVKKSWHHKFILNVEIRLSEHLE